MSYSGRVSKLSHKAQAAAQQQQEETPQLKRRTSTKQKKTSPAVESNLAEREALAASVLTEMFPEASNTVDSSNNLGPSSKRPRSTEDDSQIIKAKKSRSAVPGASPNLTQAGSSFMNLDLDSTVQSSTKPSDQIIDIMDAETSNPKRYSPPTVKRKSKPKTKRPNIVESEDSDEDALMETYDLSDGSRSPPSAKVIKGRQGKEKAKAVLTSNQTNQTNQGKDIHSKSTPAVDSSKTITPQANVAQTKNKLPTIKKIKGASTAMNSVRVNPPAPVLVAIPPVPRKLKPPLPQISGLNLQDPATYQQLFKPSTGLNSSSTYGSGVSGGGTLTRREKDDLRRADLMKQRDAAKVVREEALRTVVERDGKWVTRAERVNKFEAVLRSRRSAAAWPNLLAASWVQERHMRQKDEREAQRRAETSQV